MGEQLTPQEIAKLRRSLKAAELYLRLAWAGALDEEAQAQLQTAERAIAAAREIVGDEANADGVQSWEAQ